MVPATLLVVFLAQATPAPQAPPASPTPSPHAQGAGSGAYVPQRVYDTRRKAFTDFETMLADLARADAARQEEPHLRTDGLVGAVEAAGRRVSRRPGPAHWPGERRGGAR